MRKAHQMYPTTTTTTTFSYKIICTHQLASRLCLQHHHHRAADGSVKEGAREGGGMWVGGGWHWSRVTPSQILTQQTHDFPTGSLTRGASCTVHKAWQVTLINGNGEMWGWGDGVVQSDVPLLQQRTNWGWNSAICSESYGKGKGKEWETLPERLLIGSAG